MISPPKNNPFASVRIVEFRNLLMGRFIFIMGLRMMATLVGWWIYILTNDPFAIGLIGLSEVVPAVSLALYAGHVIDQSEKKWLLLRGVLLYIVAAGLLAFISGHYVAAHFSHHWIAIFIYSVIFG
ncbi:MAG: MFS transporter, partial [Bacteroidota bacterium]|nr:MFS transporter [Bacteroidota bacterium]